MGNAIQTSRQSLHAHLQPLCLDDPVRLGSTGGQQHGVGRERKQEWQRETGGGEIVVIDGQRLRQCGRETEASGRETEASGR